jgi:hypothetical protein
LKILLKQGQGMLPPAGSRNIYCHSDADADADIEAAIAGAQAVVVTLKSRPLHGL